ncbi:HD domain-containing protein [Cohnella nanjingensis]|uniref:HD domain-containing protein n=1 Tax=Cohnella nanjingensis TaxID=1387779 RepID=A0A7X0RKZ1_9BACL|nr:HD domain-containing protein [Cohnella nanjingensis]MBB6669276.1 HD domain-containing protein [Cohnella nanjingensis]
MTTSTESRLTQQLAFLLEIDKLKQVLRRTLILDGSRQENDAEHSWHVAMLAAILHEHAPDPKPDIARIVRMLLIHDLVEIDAGDTFAYDTRGYQDKEARESAAASRLFGLLPEDQALEWRALWQEFEDGDTPEARYAAALDRLQPMLHNFHTEGHSWKKHGVTHSQAVARLRVLEHAIPPLWTFAMDLLRQSVERGYLKEE